ncbi:unnamed protein product [Timema podura]|uniref:Uncharacterized protein n=1 Tax=Timema podura TaxID=61482 RepID=A0ABN7NVN4_TIMPD|nr:unnamed protein product [Timema podura]
MQPDETIHQLSGRMLNTAARRHGDQCSWIRRQYATKQLVPGCEFETTAIDIGNHRVTMPLGSYMRLCSFMKLVIFKARGDGEAIRCFQCSSAQGADDEDTCGAYTKFDKTHHIAIECNSDESSSPGTFCMKVTQQGPKGFICKL